MAQSYKIFIKDVPLVLGKNNVSALPVGYKALDLFSEDAVYKLIEKIVNNEANTYKGFYFLHEDPQQAMKKIYDELELVEAAGGIVWNQNKELLMIFRRGKWDLPKGKIEADESKETAALREVEEESGIGKLRLLQKFDTTYHIYPERKKWLLKETHWFEMTSLDNGLSKPQASEGITKALWIPRNEIHNKLKNTYASMKDLVNRVLEEGYTASEGIE